MGIFERKKLIMEKKYEKELSSRLNEKLIENLNEMILHLPKHYNFEIHKTIIRILELKTKTIALQFPEGLLIFACKISDIFTKICNVKTIILGDVTYGACCIDDFKCLHLKVDLIIHYGHSCLFPVHMSKVNVLYIFVTINLNLKHLCETVKKNFKKSAKISLVSTIQFFNSLSKIQSELNEYKIFIPQVKPLSKGEILGCTSPILNDIDAILYIGDGRFHIESIMIQNPTINAYKYDPYSKKLTIEKFDHSKMFSQRLNAISKAREAKKIGIILSTLGRQGNVVILEKFEKILQERNIKFITVLLSEIYPSKLSLFNDVDAWIQIACPRLTIDWGESFEKPLLNAYEGYVMLNLTQWKDVYPMNNYSQEKNEWSNNYINWKRQKVSGKQKLEKKKLLKERIKKFKQKNELNK